MEHDLGCTAIMRKVLKADNKTTYGETAIVNAMNKLRANPAWRGDREEGSGAPRVTTAKQDKAIVRYALKWRGKEKVTVARIKKNFPDLREFSDFLVEDRLHLANLFWLRRRRKCVVPEKYLQPRIDYCKGVKRKHDSTLAKWAYTDGTVYYLDRTEAEHESTVRASLGPFVYRRSDNADAMYQDCIGPSCYSKAQGIPVRVWGMLACGVLYIHILDEGEAMDRMLYCELIEDKFESWCGNCEYLVCDFERCLHTEECILALGKIGLTLVEGYPPVSQDFNAIENVWAVLKERLDETVPVQLESRADFVKRLKAAVLWANRSRAEQLWHLSTNQKERAADCLASTPPGGRTKH